MFSNWVQKGKSSRKWDLSWRYERHRFKIYNRSPARAGTHWLELRAPSPRAVRSPCSSRTVGHAGRVGFSLLRGSGGRWRAKGWCGGARTLKAYGVARAQKPMKPVTSLQDHFYPTPLLQDRTLRVHHYLPSGKRETLLYLRGVIEPIQPYWFQFEHQAPRDRTISWTPSALPTSFLLQSLVSETQIYSLIFFFTKNLVTREKKIVGKCRGESRDSSLL